MKSDRVSHKKGFSLQISLLIPFILLFFITATVTAWLFFRTTRDHLDFQIAVYQEMVLDNTVLKLERFMEKPHLMNASVRNALQLDPDLYRDLPRMRRTFLSYLEVYTTVMAGGLGIESSGNFISAARNIGGWYETSFHEKEVSPAYYYYKLDDRGEPADLIKRRETYNLKERSWYRNAVLAEEPGWSSIYTFAANRDIGLTAVLPLYREGELTGVLQSAFSLSFINGFLRELRLEGDHRIIIYDESRLLVGTSGTAPVVTADGDGKLRRVGLDDTEDALIRSLSRSGALDRQKGETRICDSPEGRSRFYLKCRSYSDPYGLNWTVVIADIRKDFTADLEKVLRKNLWISALAALLCIIIGTLLLRFLIKPVLSLNRAVRKFTEDYRTGDFKEDGTGEIRELSLGFLRMAEQIREMMTGLESRVAERTAELEESTARIKTLSGLVPICANCKKIRDDSGYWNRIEAYIESHTDAMFTHGLCPECTEKLYGDQEWYKKHKEEQPD